MLSTACCEGERSRGTCLVEVVVEVGVAGAQISSEDGGVRGEHCGDVDVSRATDDQAH